MFAAAWAGMVLGVQVNPVASVAGAALAAALATAHRTWAAAFVLCGAWLIGDGAQVFVRATGALAGPGLVAGGPDAQWVALGLWALTGVAVGYVLPAWAGAFVGRRVTYGTGWLAAAAVAATASGALGALA